MKVITLDKTKELLGITDTASDSAISAKIPYIDSKVKQITNNRYNMQIQGDITSGSPYIPVYSVTTSTGVSYEYNRSRRRYYSSGINNYNSIDDLNEYLEIGQLITGAGIPAETYIDEIFYNGYDYEISGETYGIPFIKLSADATETTSSGQLFLGIPNAYQDIIAKGIQYLINGTSTRLPGNTLTSERIGTVAYEYADNKKNNRYGMPEWFVAAFPVYTSGH